MTILKVKDVMTPEPHCIDIDTDLATAQQLMSEYQVRHLPVLENGKAFSLLTENDANLAIAAHRNLQSEQEISVRDVCSLNAYVIDPETPLDEVVFEMSARHITYALVVDVEQVVGIFTAVDACRFLGECLHAKR